MTNKESTQNKPINLESGSTTAAIIALVLLVILGVGYAWMYDDMEDGNHMNVSGNSTTTGYTYTFSDPVTSTTTVAHTVTRTTPVRTIAVEQVGAPLAAGTRYHDSTYGLTLGFPLSWAGYSSYETAGGPNGLSGIKQIHFVAPGESSDSFVVNIFTLEQWRNIKNQENFAHQNTPSLGEGTYMGVNFSYAYSAHVYSHSDVVNTVINSARFY